MHTSTASSIDVTRALCAYAARFHGSIGDGHHVASPLGAWMLLALGARGAEGRLRDELTAVLGVDVDLAAAFAGRLLEAPHPAVASAAAIWTRAGLPADGMAGWLAQLPAAVERGEIPGQAALDAWAKKKTLGLIEKFPVGLDPRAVLLLATALATKVSWEQPFGVVSSRRLDGKGAFELELGGRRGERPAGRSNPSGQWSSRVERALLAHEGASHSALVARTERAGDVAVHAVQAEEGLLVTSVIAERNVPPLRVLAVAHELAIALATGEPIARRSLFDLPLGKSSLWTIEEYEERTFTPGERMEWCTAVLPAWSATSKHSLADAGLGFPAVAAGLLRLAGMPDAGYAAAQSAVARYSRTGFEAAAISALAFAGAAGSPLPPERGLVRRGEIRFGHPFAVVAVCAARPQWGRTQGAARIAWHGLPVYSAWVTEPSETEEVEDPFEAFRKEMGRERTSQLKEMGKRERQDRMS